MHVVPTAPDAKQRAAPPGPSAGRVRVWWASFFATPIPGLLAGLAAILAAGWYLLNPYRNFYWDMENIMWMMTYQGRHFAETGSFALQFTNAQVCGMPYPLFYGWGFFPVAGLLTNLIGANLALRAFLFLAMALQYAHVVRLGRRVRCSWILRHATAVALTWSIYALTNLYTRCAMMELISICLLAASLSSWVVVILEAPDARNRYDRWAWGCYFTLASFAHAITLLYGGILLALCGLVGVCLAPHRRALVGNALCTLGAWLACMLPWLAIMTRFHDGIYVGSWGQLSGTFGWTFLMDRWQDQVRVKLYPTAREMWHVPPGHEMGYLDTQIADALLLAVLALAILVVFRLAPPGAQPRRRSGLALALLGGAVAALCFVGACVPEWTFWTVSIFAPAQTPYRLVSYINLGLLLALAGLGAALATSPARQKVSAVVAVLMLTLATMGLLSKMHTANYFGTQTRESWTLSHPCDVTAQLSCFYGRGDYAIPGDLPKLSANGMPTSHLVFFQHHGGRLDDIQPRVVNLTTPTFITTQIQVFPWNHLIVDGREPGPGQLGYDREIDHDNPSYACVLPAGVHVLSYEYRPWRGLGALYLLTALVAGAWTLGVARAALGDLWRHYDDKLLFTPRPRDLS